MSIRHGLLALLERGPRYGYQLRVEFEQATAGTWPLNIGQVYTTLSRLERDGLVRALPETDGGQRPYEISKAGRIELTTWFATPIEQADRPRDELAIKLALALTTPGVDAGTVIQNQRSATMRRLQEYTRLKSTQDGSGELTWLLILDSMIFQAEAEMRWLDHCEATLVRYPDPTGRGRSRAIAPIAADRQTADPAANKAAAKNAAAKNTAAKNTAAKNIAADDAAANTRRRS